MKSPFKQPEQSQQKPSQTTLEPKPSFVALGGKDDPSEARKQIRLPAVDAFAISGKQAAVHLRSGHIVEISGLSAPELMSELAKAGIKTLIRFGDPSESRGRPAWISPNAIKSFVDTKAEEPRTGRFIHSVQVYLRGGQTITLENLSQADFGRQLHGEVIDAAAKISSLSLETNTLKLRAGESRHLRCFATKLEPKPTGDIGAAPKRLTSDQAAIWDEIIAQTAARVLKSSDRPMLEMACRLQDKFQRDCIRTGELSILQTCYSKLGFSPVDRVRVQVPPAPTDPDVDPLDQLEVAQGQRVQ